MLSNAFSIAPIFRNSDSFLKVVFAILAKQQFFDENVDKIGEM